MSKYTKYITGFVAQHFTADGDFISQEFIKDTDYIEDDEGETIDETDLELDFDVTLEYVKPVLASEVSDISSHLLVVAVELGIESPAVESHNGIPAIVSKTTGDIYTISLRKLSR